MLLVALVALGSATYAWFTVSKTVTANDMVVKAIASAGLQICNTDDGGGTYDTTVSFGQTSTPYQLKPVSWNGTTADGFIPAANVTDGTNGTYTGEFKAGDAASPAAATTGLAMGKTTSNFAIYKVWVRSAPTSASGETFASDSHSVQAKVTITGDNASFARVKFLDDTTVKGIYAVQSTASVSTNNVVAAAGSTKTTYTTAKQDTFTAVSSTTANAEVGKPFTIVVWFDGEDADCKDSGKDKTATIQLTFEATDM